MRTQLIPRRQWTISLCGCCDYVNSRGTNLFCPYFCPMSMIGTCCISGRVESLLMAEDHICCEMGFTGFYWCCLGVPFSVCGPLGGAVYFAVLSEYQRSRAVKTFSVEEEEPCCCCNSLWRACHYPCSYYQMYVSLKEWREDSKSDVPIAQPANGAITDSSRGRLESRIFRIALPPSARPGQTINVFLPEVNMCVDVLVPSHLPSPVGDGKVVDCRLDVPIDSSDSYFDDSRC